MTMESTNRPLGGAGSDEELLAGLWEYSPFPRLPWDAPAELREFVEDVENPRRVYTIHCASRRHNFQLMVQQYVIQLRQGCGDITCCNPTCFTCRIRIAGRSPIRRYNSISARTLAVHLASQDNPEAGLCPALRHPKAATPGVDSLVLVPKRPPAVGGLGTDRSGSNRSAAHPHVGQKGEIPEAERASRLSLTRSGTAPHAGMLNIPPPEAPKFTITENPVNKDYRSFAANLFGTMAFKMVEWLTPTSITKMVEEAESLERQPRPISTEAGTASVPKSAASVPVHKKVPNGSSSRHGNPKMTPAVAFANDGDRGKTLSASQTANATNAANTPRRNSNARVRTTNSANPQRRLSVDAFPADSADELPSGLRSPRTSGLSGDNRNHKLATPKSLKPRPISQLSTSGFFDDVPEDKMPPPKTAEILPPTADDKTDDSQHSGNASSSSSSGGGGSSSSSSSNSNSNSSNNSLKLVGSSSSRSPSSDRSPADQPSLPSSETEELDASVDIESYLPQTIARFEPEVIDFLCDVLQHDCTTEVNILEPPTVTKFRARTAGQYRTWRRKQKPYYYCKIIKLREEWRLFVEQSFFYVLSDPRALIRSFTKQGQLYDSQTLWYYMLRLTHVSPSVVFHSLWMASEALFAPPKALQAMRSPTARLFPRVRKSLTNAEAGMLMSICLHALVALAPAVDSARKLYDMSRIRANGLSTAGGGAVAQQPLDLCLDYDDVFTNELALRLARRLLAAITTRRCFDEMVDHDVDLPRDHSSRKNGSRDAHNEPDILDPLFAQLDFLNMDAAYILDFTLPDRALHETRMPTLLLDWARAVMLQDWDGCPVIQGDSPFGGALALISAIYERRQALLVGDVQFRSEYFAERLDEVEVAIAWLSFTSTKQKLHLLDYPFLFSPQTLISYFRAINFSRMSRSFEESTSLTSRMNAIISPGSLVINPHQKTVLQDLLRTASCKYLILDIGRSTVLQDAFDQLWRREERELVRPLKVHLGEETGEAGFDSGGVQQEFFRLAMAEALDHEFGAFTVDDRTRMAWFNPATLEADWKYELIGLLVSLSIYNGLTLPVTFPKALYRKLLGLPVTELHHISDGWPDLANGLTTLLEWNEQEGAVEDVFVRTYEFSIDMFGKPVSRVMNASGEWPSLRESILGQNAGKSSSASSAVHNGSAAAESSSSSAAVRAAAAADAAAADADADAPMVTKENRNAYVTDYIRYLTDVSVHNQYEAFSRGFRTCLHPKSLQLLTPALLQSLVEGQQEIDIMDLRMYTRYVGFDPAQQAIQDFWAIVSHYDDRMKRKLLEFVTASDRVPVGGMKNIRFVIQKNGHEDSEGGHLPTAYTCYGTLLLPEYRDYDVLKKQLATALENTQGFGFA